MAHKVCTALSSICCVLQPYLPFVPDEAGADLALCGACNPVDCRGCNLTSFMPVRCRMSRVKTLRFSCQFRRWGRPRRYMMIDLNAVVDEHGVRPVAHFRIAVISNATGKALPAGADRARQSCKILLSAGVHEGVNLHPLEAHSREIHRHDRQALGVLIRDAHISAVAQYPLDFRRIMHFTVGPCVLAICVPHCEQCFQQGEQRLFRMVGGIAAARWFWVIWS